MAQAFEMELQFVEENGRWLEVAEGKLGDLG